MLSPKKTTRSPSRRAKASCANAACANAAEPAAVNATRRPSHLLPEVMPASIPLASNRTFQYDSPEGWFMNSEQNRRKFLGTAAAAAAFTIVPRHVLGGPGI